MKLLLLAALLALMQLATVSGLDDYCFGKDTERTQTLHFTSKTAYQILKKTTNENQYLVPGCTAQKIWIMHRHGTRLPSENTIKKAPRLEELRDEIVKNYRVRRTQPSVGGLCTEDLIALQMWKWNTSITVEQTNYLTSQGYEDLRGTARFYQKMYPEVLAKEYNNSIYLFRHSETQRTTESFKAFTEGLFGSNNAAQAEPIPEQDLLLRPYDYCESWNEHDFKGPNSESQKFRDLPLWNSTLAEISTRLGFLYTLEEEDVELMYDICRYEQAWLVDRTSVWCAAFLPSHVTVFEYEDDLKYYYKSGHGYEGNSRLSCHAVQDMLRHLGTNAMPNAVAYMAHSMAVQTLISALGMKKDDVALTAANYNNMTDRQWQASKIDPFAANLVAVKYHCPSDLVEQTKVSFFLNQNAVELDWCNVGLCNWSEMEKRYATLLGANCDEYYCQRDGSRAMGVSFAALLLAAIVYLIY